LYIHQFLNQEFFSEYSSIVDSAVESIEEKFDVVEESPLTHLLLIREPKLSDIRMNQFETE
jgi:hypothetical protein